MAVGLLVNGLSTYLFLAVAKRALGDDGYEPLAVLWSLTFILGPGLFQPLEQEVARVTAHRASRGDGSAPVLRQASLIGGVELAVVVVCVLVAWPFGLSRLLDHNSNLLIALLLTLVAFAAAELVRGVLSGRHLFWGYSTFFGIEGLARLGAAALFGAIGFSAVGLYALSIPFALTLAAIGAASVQRPLANPGSDADWRELTPALGWLLAAALSEAFMLNFGVVAVKMLHGDAGVFLNGLIISRVPLFFFQAIKAALLPNLASLAGAGDMEGFRKVQLQMVALVSAMTVAGIVASAAIGPLLVERLFNDTLGRRDMALLAAGGGGLMIVLALSIGLVALGHTRLTVAGWLTGVIGFPIGLQFGTDVFLRVEIGLVLAVASAAVVMAALLRGVYAVHTQGEEMNSQRKVVSG